MSSINGMASVNAQVEIEASPERVWSMLADPARFSSWVDNHEGFVGEPPTALAPGASFAQRLRVLNMPAEVRWVVGGLEQPRRLVLEGTGPMGIGLEATHLVAPTATGSSVSSTYEFKGAAVVAVAGQLEREVGASLRASLASLKRLAEAA